MERSLLDVYINVAMVWTDLEHVTFLFVKFGGEYALIHQRILALKRVLML